MESIKELLSFLRGIFFILLATLFSLVAYIVNKDLSFIKFFISVYAIFVLLVIEIILFWYIYKNIEKLKEME